MLLKYIMIILTDMRAIYLKSVKSPCLNGQAGRFKMQFNAKGDLDRDIYSQSLSEGQGMSEYEEDSFCVGNDEDGNHRV